MNLGAVQQAVYTRLSNFTALTSQLGSTGIKSRVPQVTEAEAEAAFPYVTFGFPSVLPWDTKSDDGGNAILQVHVWSRSQSSLQYQSILTSVYDALDKYDLVISGAATVTVDFQGSTYFEDPDGVTVHGISDFRITYDGI